MTVSPGAVTGGPADVALADQTPAPAPASTSKKVPSSSENSRRHSSLGLSTLLARAELELQPVSNPLLRLVARVSSFRGFGTRLLGHSGNLHPESGVGEWGCGAEIHGGDARLNPTGP